MWPTPPKTCKVSNFLLLLLDPLSPLIIRTLWPTIILDQKNIPAASLNPLQKSNHALLHGCDNLFHFWFLLRPKMHFWSLFVPLLGRGHENTTIHTNFLFVEFSIPHFSQSKAVNAKCRPFLNVGRPPFLGFQKHIFLVNMRQFGKVKK